MTKNDWDAIYEESGRKDKPEEPKKKPQKTRGVLTGLNKKFYEQELRPLELAGAVVRYEEIKLLAIRGGIDTKDTWYTPDFFVDEKNGELPIFYEVKGYWRQKDRKQTMAAAERFRGVYQIVGVQYIGGAWVDERF